MVSDVRQALGNIYTRVREEPRVRLDDMKCRWQGAPDGLPIPPLELIYLVIASRETRHFIESGGVAARSITDTLARQNLRMDDFDAILDFGCGCGRVMRHWRGLHHAKLYGCDYNLRLVAWARTNLPFAQYAVNQLHPPLSYADQTFDFIYACSVFTHLPEELQFHWMDELSRVLRPGGYLLITTHGEGRVNVLPPEDQERFRAGEMLIWGEEVAGTNRCASFHPEAYVREVLARRLTVVEFVPTGWYFQDVYLMKRPI